MQPGFLVKHFKALLKREEYEKDKSTHGKIVIDNESPDFSCKETIEKKNFAHKYDSSFMPVLFFMEDTWT